MTAPARPTAADLWHRAAKVRDEWLATGLTTEPADRHTAEEAITTIYVRHRRPRPEFLWVPSPRAALAHLTGLPTHDDLRAWVATRRPSGSPPLASDIAAGLSHLRSSLADGYDELPPSRPAPKRRKGTPWPVMPPEEALAAGLPFHEILRQGVFGSLTRSLADGVRRHIRAALGPAPVGWYGNQDAPWIAFFDVQRRLGLAPDRQALDLWATLARSAGWWWPGERHCVMVERPSSLETVPAAGGTEIRLRRVEYRDGWSVSSDPFGIPR